MLFAEGKATENSIKRARTHIVGEYLIIPGRSVDSDPRRDRRDFQGNRDEKSVALNYGFVRFPPTQRNTLSTVSSQG